MGQPNIIEKYGHHFTLFAKRRIQEIDSEMEQKVAPLMKEKNELLELLDTIKGSGSNGKSNGVLQNVYDLGFSLVDKAVFVTRGQVYLPISEIAEKINKIDPDLTVEDLKAKLSAVLSMEVKKKDQSLARMVRKLSDEGKWVYRAVK